MYASTFLQFYAVTVPRKYVFMGYSEVNHTDVVTNEKGGHCWPPSTHTRLSGKRAAVFTYVLQTTASKADVLAHVYCLRESA